MTTATIAAPVTTIRWRTVYLRAKAKAFQIRYFETREAARAYKRVAEKHAAKSFVERSENGGPWVRVR